MIQNQTLLKVTDNSGVKTAKCIKVLGKSKIAKIGSIIIVSVKKLKKNSNELIKLSRKSVQKALVLRTNFFLKQSNGFYVKFFNNSIVFLDKQQNLVGTRIFGFIPKNLKKKFNKLVGFSFYLI